MSLNSLHGMMKNASDLSNLKNRKAKVIAYPLKIYSNREIIMIALIAPSITRKILNAPLSDNELVFPSRARLVEGSDTSLGQHGVPGRIIVDDLTGEVVEIQIKQ